MTRKRKTARKTREKGKDKEMKESTEGDNLQQADAHLQAVSFKDQPSETGAG